VDFSYLFRTFCILHCFLFSCLFAYSGFQHILCYFFFVLSVSLDCLFVIVLRYSLTFICSVSCVPYVVSFSGLSICYCPTVFSYVYLFCVLCTLCCQFLWIVHLLLPYGILSRLFVLCLVYSMLSVSLDCPFVIAPLVFSNVYLSQVNISFLHYEKH
jgi:hypothetical protein